jgi:sec-independent protein translocase protein TatC
MADSSSEDRKSEIENQMTLGEHLEELRRRLIYSLLGLAVGMVGSLFFAVEVIRLLGHPYREALRQLGIGDESLAVLSVGAGFDVYMKTALYCGLLVASPWIIHQAWAFISAGLYRRERRVVSAAVPFFVLLFLAGASFFYFLVAVPAIRFLVHFDALLGVKPIITLQNQIGFMGEMMIVFGLAFQTPLIILLLAKIGLVDMGTLRKYRRHAIVVIAAFAAVFAPADVVSMFALGVPMWMLYELGAALAHFLVFKKRGEES